MEETISRTEGVGYSTEDEFTRKSEQLAQLRVLQTLAEQISGESSGAAGAIAARLYSWENKVAARLRSKSKRGEFKNYGMTYVTTKTSRGFGIRVPYAADESNARRDETVPNFDK